MSKNLKGNNSPSSISTKTECKRKGNKKKKIQIEGKFECSSMSKSVKVGDTSETVNLIHQIVAAGKGSKTGLKIEVEFTNK